MAKCFTKYTKKGLRAAHRVSMTWLKIENHVAVEHCCNILLCSKFVPMFTFLRFLYSIKRKTGNFGEVPFIFAQDTHLRKSELTMWFVHRI